MVNMQLYRYNGQLTNYQIDETGKLFNVKTKKFLKGSINKHGYLTYTINICGYAKTLYAHRMIAETYLSHSAEKDCVNHKDGNKLNNALSNLEWVTKADNNRHAILNKLNPLEKQVYCFDKNKNLVCVFSSLNDAHRLTNIAINSIADNAAAVAKPLCKGYYFNYSESNNFDTYVTTGGGRKPIARFSLDGKLLEKYETIAEASKLSHLPRTRISDCAHGKIKTYGGYIWKFIS